MVQQEFAKPYFDESEAIRNKFSGFVFFTNTASSSPFTSLSMNSILRGRMFEGKVNNIPPDDNLLHDLIADNYLTSVTGIPTDFIAGKYPENTVLPGIMIGDAYKEAFAAVALGLNRYWPFKWSPYIGKPIEFGWMSKRDQRDAFDFFIKQVHVEKHIDKKFIWFHSLQTHYPVRFTKDGVFSLDLTPDDVYGEIVDALTMVGRLIDRLKELNIYDNSLIFIISDHGFLPLPKMKSLNAEKNYLLYPISMPLVRLGQYSPLLMMKPPHRNEPLGYSDSAAALIDIRKTINEFTSSGRGEPFTGVNLLDFAKNPKERTVPAFKLLLKENTLQMFNSTEDWEEVTLKLPFSKYFLENSDEIFAKSLQDLLALKSALATYYKEHGAYPASEGFDGLNSKWGYSGPDWIKNLAPVYLPALPQGRSHADSPTFQYLYKSDGKNYKLIFLDGDLMTNIIRRLYPDMIDPMRQTSAYGYWTEGAEQW